MSEFSERLQITDKMASAIVDSQDYLFSWFEGSAQTGKSLTAALITALRIENSSPQDKLFMALGYTTSSAINNIWYCGGFGVENYFAGNCSRGMYPGTSIDCLRIRTKNGEKYLLACGANTKTSNNCWHGFKISGFCVDEIDRICQESIDEMFQRITTIQQPFIVCTQNPNIPTHPIYKLLDTLLSNGKCNYVHWTLDDNPALSTEKIHEIKSRYDPSSVQYKRYVLGQRVAPGSTIYTLHDYSTFNNEDEYISYVIACDPGETVSATSITLNALRRGFKRY